MTEIFRYSKVADWLFVWPPELDVESLEDSLKMIMIQFSPIEALPIDESIFKVKFFVSNFQGLPDHLINFKKHFN